MAEPSRMPVYGHNSADSSAARSQLPEEVAEQILAHLPAHALARASQVSRTLNRIATNPALWERHYISFWKMGEERNEERRGTRAWSEWRRLSDIRRRAVKARRAAQQSVAGSSQDSSSQGRNSSAVLEGLSLEAQPNRPVEYQGASLIASLLRAALASAPVFRPEFYQLYLERLDIDEKILQALEEQCKSSSGWIRRAEALVERYGDDMRDVLEAVVEVQRKKAGSLIPSGNAHSDSGTAEGALEMNNKTKGDWPRAYNLHSRRALRSRSHHLVLLHHALELLEHLQRREAVRGLKRLGQQEEGVLPPRQQRSVGIQHQETGVVDHEQALAFLALFRGGDAQKVSFDLRCLCSTTAKRSQGQSCGKKEHPKTRHLASSCLSSPYQIRSELDTLAVACELFLERHQTFQGDVASHVKGICAFMQDCDFSSARPGKYHDLDNREWSTFLPP